ncbi:FixH family protein [Mucilaginibacter litoreus]|uniref:FixH family protein n=1 Tax=Mucilaginibacter litoreus TaxID=1048221 RepID=A0ABW3AWZ8_9SPHI
MNWGKGLVIGMLIFMAFIVSLSVYMFKMPEDDYDHQYYEKGLTFDKDYQREQLVVADKAQPSFKQTGGVITVQFKQPAVGSIKFISNLGADKDRVFELSTGTSNIATIKAADKLAPGQWNTIVSWSSNNKQYLFKQELYVDGR